MHEQATVTDDYITLTEAAKIAPGRPSTNCIWRWCRRGVKARGGERVRLQHVRIGGMIYTTARWLEAFGRALADADAKYFDPCEAAVEAARAKELPAPRPARRGSTYEQEELREIEEAERELDEASS